MSWKLVSSALTAVFVLAFVTPSTAADELYGRSGPYVAGGGTYAFQEFSGSASKHDSPDNAWGYQIKGGYRFNEWFALEIDWSHLPKFGDSTGDTEVLQLDADAKFYPFHGIVQPYLLAGAGWNSVNDKRAGGDDTNGAGFRFGGGLDFYITRNWGLYTEADYLLGTGSRSNYGSVPLSFGVLYRFY
ncbi:MAG TPA: porin family protein [Candidatus Binatia bacterium]|jgi:hypothetical protein